MQKKASYSSWMVDPAPEGPEVVAEVGLAGGLDPAEDPLCVC